MRSRRGRFSEDRNSRQFQRSDGRSKLLLGGRSSLGGLVSESAGSYKRNFSSSRPSIISRPHHFIQNNTRNKPSLQPSSSEYWPSLSFWLLRASKNNEPNSTHAINIKTAASAPSSVFDRHPIVTLHLQREDPTLLPSLCRPCRFLAFPQSLIHQNCITHRGEAIAKFFKGTAAGEIPSLLVLALNPFFPTCRSPIIQQ
mmetsp:Transcript_43295/g.90943  ORF Transcript_43295/g.90943 Transcript_43295/m.90943 type:complete len:199 (-) Transcript_43295:609-1205(-)